MPEVKEKKARKKESVSKAIRDPEVPVAVETPVPSDPAPDPAPAPAPAPAIENKPAETPKAEAPKPTMAKPVPTPKPVPGKLISGQDGVKRVFAGPDPKALSRMVAAMLGINPRDSRFFMEHVASLKRKEIPVAVCIRCGLHVPKSNVMNRLDLFALILDMRVGIPSLHALTTAVLDVVVPRKYIREDISLIGGFCPRCVLELGNSMPPMLRIPEYENESAPELRSLILDIIQMNRVESAILAMKRILQEEDNES